MVHRVNEFCDVQGDVYDGLMVTSGSDSDTVGEHTQYTYQYNTLPDQDEIRRPVLLAGRLTLPRGLYPTA